MNHLRFLIVGVVSLWLGFAASAAETLVYFGTYTGKKSKGIYVSRLDQATGRLASPELVSETSSPSFLAVHPSGKSLYAVNEVSRFDGKTSGAVSGYGIDSASGKLTPLNQEPSVGAGPCHLIVDAAGKNVLVANYGGGSVTVLPLEADGRLKPSSCFVQHKGSSANPQRQEGPHAHGIYLDQGNQFAYVPDLGLDKVLIYKFNAAQGKLEPNDPPAGALAPGSGPRHFALHPSGKFAYVISEILCTVTAFSRDPKQGSLSEIQTVSSLPLGQKVRSGYSTAELFMHPSGQFLYGSNRGHDSIVVLAIDAQDGKLSLVQHASTQGKVPRSFGIDPSGQWLLAANQDSDSVVVFEIVKGSGSLRPTGQVIEVGAPVSVVFAPKS
jgi:6-phosphogluconolactonase